MTPSRLLNLAIVPALAELEHFGIPDSYDARRLLLTIALQESNLSHRRQVISGGGENGPAASFWQGEITGGLCKGVLTHPATAVRMREICVAFNVFATPQGLWEAIRYNDIVAAVAARLLVYTLPSKLPTSAQAGWTQYANAWRPGKPHPEKWASNWDLATLTIGEK
jgi:hypothetical protein